MSSPSRELCRSTLRIPRWPTYVVDPSVTRLGGTPTREFASTSVVYDAQWSRSARACVSTRRVEGLVNTLGIERLSKSQVSELAKRLDAERRSGPGPSTPAPAMCARHADPQGPRGRPHRQR